MMASALPLIARIKGTSHASRSSYGAPPGLASPTMIHWSPQVRR